MRASYFTKIKWSLKRRGLIGTIRLAMLKAPRRVVDWVWDRVHHVDTGEIIEIDEMNVSSENAVHGNRYQATPSEVFRRVIGSLNIPYGEYTFIDYGSGKGRTLLLGAAFPFRRIIGLEFAPSLHRAAESNIRTFRGVRKCKDIEAICMDASAYPLTPGKFVLFFNFPFHEPVMKRVMSQIDDLLRGSRSEVLIVNYEPSPVISRLIGADPFFRVAAQSIEHIVYRSVPASVRSQDPVAAACHRK